MLVSQLAYKHRGGEKKACITGWNKDIEGWKQRELEKRQGVIKKRESWEYREGHSQWPNTLEWNNRSGVMRWRREEERLPRSKKFILTQLEINKTAKLLFFTYNRFCRNNSCGISRILVECKWHLQLSKQIYKPHSLKSAYFNLLRNYGYSITKNEWKELAIYIQKAKM